MTQEKPARTNGHDAATGTTNGPATGAATGTGSGMGDFGALPCYIGYNLRRAQAASFRHLDPAVQAHGLSPGQFSLMMFLHANPGQSQSQIARTFGLDKSTLSPVLEALAQRQLLARARCAHDRRAYAVTLTAAGTRLMQAMQQQIEAQERLMESALHPGERAQLLDMLQRITGVLSTTPESRTDG